MVLFQRVGADSVGQKAAFCIAGILWNTWGQRRRVKAGNTLRFRRRLQRRNLSDHFRLEAFQQKVEKVRDVTVLQQVKEEEGGGWMVQRLQKRIGMRDRIPRWCELPVPPKLIHPSQVPQWLQGWGT